MGVLPAAVQKAVVLVPFSHSAAMLRQVFCEAPLAAIFAGVPPQAKTGVHEDVWDPVVLGIAGDIR